MAKLAWYMKTDKKGTEITFHPIWVWWQAIKIVFKSLRGFSSRKIKVDFVELQKSDDKAISKSCKEYLEKTKKIL